MVFTQLGFVRGATPYASAVYTCVHTIPGGKYHCKMLGFYHGQNNASSFNFFSSSFTPGMFRLSSNEFFINDTVGNAKAQIGNDWIFHNIDDFNRFWGDMNFELVLSGQPITFRFSAFFGTVDVNLLDSFIFNLDLTPIDVMTSIEKPLPLPHVARLIMIPLGTSVSGLKITVNVPVNANGRFKCRVLAIQYCQSGISSFQPQCIPIRSQALNNFGYLGGSGYPWITLDLDQSCFPHRKPTEFLSGTINGMIDFTFTPISIFNFMMMYLEMMRVVDRED